MDFIYNLLVWVLLFSLATQLDELHVDSYRIDCGSPVNTTLGGHIFMGDSYGDKFLITPLKILANTSTYTNLQLYKTARFFNGTTIYKFPINSMGRYIIRLYFFSFTHHNYNISNIKFSLSSQQFLFLRDFSPKPNTMEYSINVVSKFFDITIEPSLNCVAILNAFEVFRAPDVLFQDDATVINTNKTFLSFLSTALETIVRVNMGGPTIEYNNDTLGRTWKSYDSFLEPNNFVTIVKSLSSVRYRSGLATRDAAPINVYGTCIKLNTWNDPHATFRATWKFDVEVGFQYFVRFHYCDIVSASANALYFDVFVGSWLVSKMLDLTTLANGVLGAPVYIDFVTPIIKDNKLNVSIGIPTAHVNNPCAILNGIEIMKMSNDMNSLDENVPLPPIQKSSKNNQSRVIIIRSVVVVVVALFLVSVVILSFVCRRNNIAAEGHSTSSSTTTNNNANAIVTSEASGQRIPLAMIQAATNGFDDSLAIGRGGFGKVYKGVFADGTKVAVKRGLDRNELAQTAFQTEIELLSQCRHRHLVNLIGFCDENNENILVYQYMENGTLKQHLYGSESCITWKQRLDICIGAAKGIQTLHNDYPTVVIHRDIKSSNILLDEKFIAKVGDFGLSKAMPSLNAVYISTNLRGTDGYIDPQYFRTRRATNKSDVYSFGVVLFEVLCGRAVIDTSLPEDEVSLVEWALNKKKNGELKNIIDPKLQGSIKADSLRIFGELAEKCVNDKQVERPSIDYVVWNLEYALQLQVGDPVDTQEQSAPRDDNLSEVTTSAHCRTTTDDDLTSGSMNKVVTDMLSI